MPDADPPRARNQDADTPRTGAAVRTVSASTARTYPESVFRITGSFDYSAFSSGFDEGFD